jgi:hypothetical protein
MVDNARGLEIAETGAAGDLPDAVAPVDHGQYPPLVGLEIDIAVAGHRVGHQAEHQVERGNPVAQLLPLIRPADALHDQKLVGDGDGLGVRRGQFVFVEAKVAAGKGEKGIGSIKRRHVFERGRHHLPLVEV